MKKAGAQHKDIAAFVGVREETFSRWINHPKTENQNQLCQALKKAEVQRKASLLALIYEAASKGKTWQAAAWLLERQYPDEFGRKDRKATEAKTDETPRFYFDPEEANG